jgi:L-fuconolactonase
MKNQTSRRTFLKTSLAGAVGGIVAGQLAMAQDSEIKPALIIDTHTHFYDPTRPEGVPWPPKNDKLLYRRVLPEDYRALPKPQPVNGTVVVEASAWVEDNQWILDLAADDPFIVGLVGNLPVGSDAFSGQLERFTSNPLFRGIRIHGNRAKEGLDQPQFLAGLKQVARKDGAVDLLGGPGMLPVIDALAQAIPDLRLIIDHLAGVRIDGQAPDAEWRKGMHRAARHKNVYCKVSGLVEGTGRNDGTAPKDTQFYQPVLDVVWNAFGEDRLIYGSNWPVSDRFASCATVQSIVTGYFREKGQGALDKFFWQNAQTFYKWVKRW